MYSTKKFEIIRTAPVPELVFAHEDEKDIMNKLRELENINSDLIDGLIVRNNETHQFDYAWRCLRQFNDLTVWS